MHYWLSSSFAWSVCICVLGAVCALRYAAAEANICTHVLGVFASFEVISFIFMQIEFYENKMAEEKETHSAILMPH